MNDKTFLRTIKYTLESPVKYKQLEYEIAAYVNSTDSKFKKMSLEDVEKFVFKYYNSKSTPKKILNGLKRWQKNPKFKPSELSSIHRIYIENRKRLTL